MNSIGRQQKHTHTQPHPHAGAPGVGVVSSAFSCAARFPNSRATSRRPDRQPCNPLRTSKRLGPYESVCVGHAAWHVLPTNLSTGWTPRHAAPGSDIIASRQGSLVPLEAKSFQIWNAKTDPPDKSQFISRIYLKAGCARSADLAKQVPKHFTQPNHRSTFPMKKLRGVELSVSRHPPKKKKKKKTCCFRNRCICQEERGTAFQAATKGQLL